MIRFNSCSRAGAVVLGLSFAAFSPATARAACERWDVSGYWQLRQTNGWVVFVTLTQDADGQIRGSADYAVTNGLIRQGRVSGTSLQFVVDWGAHQQGEYQGKIQPDGTLSGTTLDVKRPEVAAGWSVVSGGPNNAGKALCAKVASAAPPAPAPGQAPPPAGVVRRLGAKPSQVMAASPAQPAPPPPREATAKADVDIHSGPGGKFAKLPGFMRAGTRAPLLDYHPDGWCKLDIPSPKVVGWVAQDHLTGCP